jgi:signal transduction histidine kinase
MVVVLLVANLGPVGPASSMEQAHLNLVVAAAGLSTLGVLFFPWRRYDRNLFLVASLGGACLVAMAVYFSGGWQSPFFPLYFYVVVFAAIYYPPRVAAAVVLLTALASASPQLYAPDVARLAEHAVVFFSSYLALALVSGYMAREVGKRERARAEKERELEEAREAGEKERVRRRLVQAMARARAHERRMIGRELHDRVAQTMGVVHQSIELYGALREHDPQKAAQKLDLAKRMAVEAMEKTRDLSRTLRADESGEALRAALSEMLRDTVYPGTARELSVSGDEEAIPTEVREQLFLVLREAVRNAVSHSRAGKITVAVSVGGERIVGVVEDDGRGFERKTVGPEEIGGLAHMADRAALLGGTCSVDSAPGEGTRVEVSLPLGGAGRPAR